MFEGPFVNRLFEARTKREGRPYWALRIILRKKNTAFLFGRRFAGVALIKACFPGIASLIKVHTRDFSISF